MKRIKLTQGKFALVSNIDYAYLNQWKWCCKEDYAARHTHRPHRTLIYMHRLVLERMGFKNFKQVDHQNLDRLDNQRHNIRPATNQQNKCNRGLQTNNTSGYKGVDWHKSNEKWRARIRFNDIEIHLGLFDNPVEAAKAYNIAALVNHGKFARLNPV